MAKKHPPIIRAKGQPSDFHGTIEVPAKLNFYGGALAWIKIGPTLATPSCGGVEIDVTSYCTR